MILDMAGKQRVGVVGGTGYAGAELLRLLAVHPEVELVAVTGRRQAGVPVADAYPQLRGKIDLQFSTPEQARLEQCDVVFFATPHAAAMHEVPHLLDAGVRVIDLSADFRLQDLEIWEQWYGVAHGAPEYVS